MRAHWICGFFGGLIAGIFSLTACSDHPYDPDAPAIDPNAPRVHILSPARGTFAGDVPTLVVTGTATDDTQVVSIEVNGIAAALSGDGTWRATIPVTAGTQLIHAEAKDADGNVGKESRAVVAGPLTPIAMPVPQAITAAISAQTFDAIGRGITGFLRTGDLAAALAPKNPVIDIGGGPSCDYVQAAITAMTAGNATTVSLIPQAGGLALDIELDHVAIGMHLAYALACVDGRRDLTIGASHIKVTGVLNIAVRHGAFDVKLTSPSVQITGFDVNLGGLPGDLIDLLHLDTSLGPILGWATETFVVPVLSHALAGLGDTRTVDVLGTAVDIHVAPAQIRFDATGAVIALDTTLRAHGDQVSPGYVAAESQVPAMPQGRGFSLAVAGDAVNQLLGSFWAARGMDKAADLDTGSYGQIGKLYDRVEISAQVPPYVDASGGALTLTIGDLLATFKNGASIATQIAVNAQIPLTVVAGSGGAPRLDIGSPITYVDILDEHVDGANALSNAQFELITSFALGRVIAVGSGAVGALPLPALGGVGIHDLNIAEQAGYLVIDGDVQ
ncbi:MAG TPA: hypothetical protein VHN14_34660 [Kofleriaceae bacterium]|jgi:hypothetical protein|nr:hypothetical protein [Kofleriaceae bacterium]